jgi:uncharacterized membrane protein YfcA
MTPEIPVLLLASLAAFLVGLSKGGLSMIGSLAVPLLALLISPVRAAAILLPVYVFSDVVGVWAYRRNFSPTILKILIPAGCVGIAIGWATASKVSDRGVGLMIGLIGLWFCVNAWRLRHRRQDVERPPDLPRGIFWGILMGFSSFVSHAGQPLYQVYVLPQRLPKLVYAGTSALVFGAINLLKLGPYWALGQFSAPNLTISLYLLLPAFAGTLLGLRLVRILPERGYYLFVQFALFAVSVDLVLKGFVR